jgi:hypothetical protein
LKEGLLMKFMKIASKSACSLLAIALSRHAASAQWVSEADPNPSVAHKSALPLGGNLVKNQKNKLEPYYFVNKWALRRHAANVKKYAELYRSLDDGKTWKLVCPFFDFTDVFVHPDTGKVFAIIRVEWLAPNSKGFLVPHSADKIISSENGTDWKHITGNRKYVATLMKIIAQPRLSW